MMRLISSISLALLSILLLVGCGADSTKSSSSSSLTTTESSAGKMTVDSVVLMNNCTGKAVADETVGEDQGIAIAVGREAGVNGAIFEARLTNQFTKKVSSFTSLTLRAPAGTDMQNTLTWRKSTFDGSASIAEMTGLVSFHIEVPDSVELKSSIDLGCLPPGNNREPTAAEAAAIPAAVRAVSNTPMTTAPQPIESAGGISDCGAITSLQVAVDTIGGRLDQWSDLGTANGYRKLKFKGVKATSDNLGILLTYPGFGSFDTFTGSGQ